MTQSYIWGSIKKGNLVKRFEILKHFQHNLIQSKRPTKCDPAGCLVLVFNYTGDRLNFGLATEQARREGRKVGSVGEIVRTLETSFGNILGFGLRNIFFGCMLLYWEDQGP